MKQVNRTQAQSFLFSGHTRNLSPSQSDGLSNKKKYFVEIEREKRFMRNKWIYTVV